MRLSRRQALTVVTGIAGTLYAKTTAVNQGGRLMSLPLDDIYAIELRHRGRVVSVTPSQLLDALSGKGEA